MTLPEALEAAGGAHAVATWAEIQTAVPNAPLPQVSVREEGQCVLAWSSPDRYAEVEVWPDGRREWFVRDRSADQHAGSEGPEEGPLRPELLGMLGALALRAKLAEIAALPDNWGGQHERAASPTAIAVATALLTAAEQAGLPPTRVLPDCEGGVGITYIKPERTVGLLVDNDGDVAVYVRAKGTPSSVAMVAPGDALGEVQRLLAGGVVAA